LVQKLVFSVVLFLLDLQLFLRLLAFLFLRLVIMSEDFLFYFSVFLHDRMSDFIGINIFAFLQIKVF
jgi:hypothetical protein